DGQPVPAASARGNLRPLDIGLRHRPNYHKKIAILLLSTG
ncbi:MAG: hypothetical protein ACI957_005891, partial [Verrucomicrobiales bacterium]